MDNRLARSICSIMAIIVPFSVASCGFQRIPHTNIKKNLGPVPNLLRENYSDYVSKQYSDEDRQPLKIAKWFSRSSGGTWVVLANKPLTELNMNSLAGRSVIYQLKSIQSNTPVYWDTSKGYLLLDFNTKEHLETIKRLPPRETTAIYLRADNDRTMLDAFADFEQIKIEADEKLLAKKAAFRSAQRKYYNHIGELYGEEEDAYHEYNYDNVESWYAENLNAPEFTAISKLTLPQLMQRLGRYYGGQCKLLPNGIWKLTPYVSELETAQETARLNSSIQSSMVHSGAIDDRDRPEITQEDRDKNDELFLCSSLTDEDMDNFDSLGIIGKPAIPTLISFLDYKHPAHTKAAIDILGAMDAPEALQALKVYSSSLFATPNVGHPLVRSALLIKTAKMIYKRDIDAGVSLLARIITDPSIAPKAKMSARMALMNHGNLSTINAMVVSFNPYECLKFQVVPYKPDTDPHSRKQDSDYNVSIVNQTRDDKGDDWGVFISGACGNPFDIWLAHGRNGKWFEFLYTGESFARYQGDTVSENDFTSLGPNECKIIVNGDAVDISPPADNPDKILTEVNKNLQNPKLPKAEKDRLEALVQTLQDRSKKILRKTYKLSLNSMRKDTDHDGLSDLIEMRLGTDPDNPDTDGDGVDDYHDANPLAKPSSNADVLMLQQIFNGIFNGRQSHIPVIVIADKRYWQEFHGTSSRVLCMSKSSYYNKLGLYTTFAVLEFVGNSNDTILNNDGQVMYNDSHTNAEVHFFCISETSIHSPYFSIDKEREAQNQIKDYVAIFNKKDDKWKLQKASIYRYEPTSELYKHYVPAE